MFGYRMPSFRDTYEYFIPPLPASGEICAWFVTTGCTLALRSRDNHEQQQERHIHTHTYLHLLHVSGILRLLLAMLGGLGDLLLLDQVQRYGSVGRLVQNLFSHLGVHLALVVRGVVMWCRHVAARFLPAVRQCSGTAVYSVFAT